MTNQILEVCANVLIISCTSVIAMGSILLISGMVMVLFGKDID